MNKKYERNVINKGVNYFDVKASKKKFRTTLSYFDGSTKSRTIGYFETFEEAVKAYKLAYLKQNQKEWMGEYSESFFRKEFYKKTGKRI